MAIGLTFDECVELKLMPPKQADRASLTAAAHMRDEAFPMSLPQAAWHVRTRGYDCRPQSLELLVEQQVIVPGDVDRWTRVEVDASATTLKSTASIYPSPTRVAFLDAATYLSSERLRRPQNARLRSTESMCEPTTSSSSCIAFRLATTRMRSSPSLFAMIFVSGSSAAKVCDGIFNTNRSQAHE